MYNKIQTFISTSIQQIAGHQFMMIDTAVSIHPMSADLAPVAQAHLAMRPVQTTAAAGAVGAVPLPVRPDAVQFVAQPDAGAVHAKAAAIERLVDAVQIAAAVRGGDIVVVVAIVVGVRADDAVHVFTFAGARRRLDGGRTLLRWRRRTGAVHLTRSAQIL